MGLAVLVVGLAFGARNSVKLGQFGVIAFAIGRSFDISIRIYWRGSHANYLLYGISERNCPLLDKT